MNENFDLRAFDAALADCVDALKQGASVHECLARYPQFAARLETYLTVAQLVERNLEHEPVTLPGAARAAILERATNAKRKNNLNAAVPLAGGGFLARLRESFRVRAPQFAFSSVAIVLIVVVSGILLNASTNTLPNNTLYPVKRVAENVQLFFTFDHSARADLLLTLAARRSNELQAMLARGGTIDPALFADLDRTLTAALDEIGQLRGEQAKTLLERAIALTQTQTNFLSAAAQNADPSMQVQLQNAADAVNQIRERAEEGRKNPQLLLTPEPTATLEPSGTATPTSTPTFELSETPHAQEATSTSTPNRAPDESVTPRPTRTPGATETQEPPEATRTPSASDTVEPTETEAGQTPNATLTPGATDSPESTETREATNTPQPTKTQQATQTPNSGNTSQPTKTPQPTQTPHPSNTPGPTQTPEPTDTPHS